MNKVKLNFVSHFVLFLSLSASAALLIVKNAPFGEISECIPLLVLRLMEQACAILSYSRFIASARALFSSSLLHRSCFSNWLK